MFAGKKSFASRGLPFWWVRPAYSLICEVAFAPSSTNVIRSTHLMHVHPYHPGTTSRMGAPWSGDNGFPFSFVARNAPALASSSNVKIQLAPSTDVADRSLYLSKPLTITRVAPGCV